MTLTRPSVAAGCGAADLDATAARRFPPALDLMSLLLAGVMVVTSSVGLWHPAVYRDNAWSTAAFRGSDFASLVLVVPVLVAAVALARRGSVLARLVWLGAVICVAYNYAFYAFGTAFNELFLLYVGGLGIAVTVLVFALPQIVPQVATDERAPVRLVGGYLVFVGATFAVVEVAQSLDYVLTGNLPQVVEDSGIHTSIVFALDLPLIVPALVVTGIQLWRRSQAGVALGTAMNTFAVLYMTTLMACGAFLAEAGVQASWSDPPYPEVGLASLVALALLARHVRARTGDRAEHP